MLPEPMRPAVAITATATVRPMLPVRSVAEAIKWLVLDPAIDIKKARVICRVAGTDSVIPLRQWLHNVRSAPTDTKPRLGLSTVVALWEPRWGPVWDRRTGVDKIVWRARRAPAVDNAHGGTGHGGTPAGAEMTARLRKKARQKARKDEEKAEQVEKAGPLGT